MSNKNSKNLRPLNSWFHCQFVVYFDRGRCLLWLTRQHWFHLNTISWDTDNHLCIIDRLGWGFNLEKLKHDDVMEWKHSPHYWPFVRGIHQSLVHSPHKGPVLCFNASFEVSLTNCWTNIQIASDLRCHNIHVMSLQWLIRHTQTKNY